MWKILRKNFKELYLFSVLMALMELAELFIFGINGFAGIVFTLLNTVMNYGWYWYVIKIHRGEAKPLNAFKEAFKKSGWIVLTDIMRVIINTLASFPAVLLIFIIFPINENMRVLIIGGGFISCLVSVRFVFAEFIYYDNRKLKPLNIIFDSLLNTKKVYFSILIPYTLIIIPFLLCFYDGVIPRAVRIAWLAVFSPVYILKICEIYDKISFENSEINDSLITVAKALDETTDKY
ncbi:MAG: hypothetical protein Q4D26_03125 [Clostridia bacterium]|nr:hypothetical protein [Clostridia bacterium]